MEHHRARPGAACERGRGEHHLHEGICNHVHGIERIRSIEAKRIQIRRGLKQMRKRTMLLPLVLCGCLVMTACTALEDQGTDEISVVERKYPVTVEEAAERAAEELETKKVEIAKAVTVKPTRKPTATPTPTPQPTEEPVEDATISAEESTFDEEGTTFDGEESTFYEEPVVPVVEEVVPVVEEPGCTDYEEEVQYGNYYEDYTDVPQQSYDAGMQYIGFFTVTWYSRDMVGYDAPGASGLGCIPYQTCALPDYSYLGRTVYVEGYGTYLCTDISPGGICDLYVLSVNDIPSYGVGSANVYIIG